MKKIPKRRSDHLDYYYENESYGAGDADYMYSMIRTIKPRRIIEIGSGFSTLIALKAIDKNREENSDYKCEMTCIEPYEFNWLEQTSANIIRNELENVDIGLFKTLKENDFLIIDSTHMIKPGGDVLKEYLEIIPLLNQGVYIHIHDIFTPRDYPVEWLVNENRFWNEQYLLEAMLIGNSSYEVVGGVNYLYHNYFELIADKFPILYEKKGLEPGSFWIRRR